MRIRLIAIGTRMPDWITEGYDDYAARLPRELKLELVELAVEHRGKNADIPRLRDAEGERLLKAAGEARIIAFDEHGTQPDTVAWSKSLKAWMQDGRDVALLIGGPDGHAPAVLARADAKWSLSKLTFPHAMVRVIVAEQLYRAWSLLNNHPYHRA